MTEDERTWAGGVLLAFLLGALGGAAMALAGLGLQLAHAARRRTRVPR